MTLWKHGSFFLAFALAGAGCDGGISDSTRLGDLTEQDVEALCEEAQDGLATPTNEQACALAAHLNPLVTTQEECEAAVETCLEDPPEPTEPTDCTTLGTYPSGCDATVGDARACSNSAKSHYQALFGRATCGNLASDRIELADLNPPSAPCEPVVAASCQP